MRSVRPQEEKEVVVEQQQQEPKRAPKLRYLDFVHVAAAQAVVCLAGLYGLAKSHAGPLRPGVDAVESAVKGLVGPVYDRFHSVPLDVLAFVDRKVIIPPGHKSPWYSPFLRGEARQRGLYGPSLGRFHTGGRDVCGRPCREL